jgi:predicted cation transporter
LGWDASWLGFGKSFVLHKMSLVVFLPFLFHGKLEEYQCEFFFKGLAEFGTESIWSWALFIYLFI